MTMLSVLGNVDRWLKYSFSNGAVPPETPTVRMTASGGWITFRAKATPGLGDILKVELQWATQLDSTVSTACDFSPIKMIRLGGDYFAFVQIGARPACGPAASVDNILYYVNVRDTEGFTVSSKMYYKAAEMDFFSGVTPRIQHYLGDGFAVPPPPPTCTRALP